MHRLRQLLPRLMMLIMIASVFLVLQTPTVFAQAGDPFGTIDTPPGVEVINQRSGLGADEIPILYFISMLIRLTTIIAGVWALLNFILAGWAYLGSGGNAQAHTQARDRTTMTVLGLLLMVSVYTIAGVIGLIFFGDASFILNPTITGPL